MDREKWSFYGGRGFRVGSCRAWVHVGGGAWHRRPIEKEIPLGRAYAVRCAMSSSDALCRCAVSDALLIETGVASIIDAV